MQQNTCKINGYQCLPISTPIKKMPICQTNTPWFCKEAILQAQQECVGLMPCITEEYTAGVDDVWTSKESSTKQLMMAFLLDKVVEELLEDQQRKYFFWIELTSDKQKPNRHYSDKIQKFVHREYLVWTDIGMVGNIGGQLSLWVGFSFTGLAAGILNVWYRGCGRLSCFKHLEKGNQEKIV